MFRKRLFNYFYECINDLVDNNININNLPDDDSKKILLWLYNQPLRSKKIHEAFNSIEDASDVLIYDCFYNNKKDVDDLDFLKTKGAKSLRISKNGKGIGFLSRISQENKKEKFQNLPQKFKPLGVAPQNNQIAFDEN